MTEATEKSRWNAKKQAHSLHSALVGLGYTFEVNGLDGGPIKKAAKALSEIADAVQAKMDTEAAAEAAYRSAVGPSTGALEALQRENEELKKRLAAQPVR